MYLKTLELQGFKSFPDKITLSFDKGLTGVVGPNGSGKSNIGDAVRWVLGEQSTKTLRGNKMEDVIFSGTTARKAVGFASVTLVLDNSSGQLKSDDAEVAVTRKLYRSGESEYRINGKNVRLKDINELFMDTGLGRDGYSIIGQGRIAEIVGAKSSERRDIFEEAAGISKFRYKKAEAERRLAQAQDNILRLQDIVSELEGRVEPLKIQSKKAEKFIALADERKRLEISLWVKKLEELKASVDGIAEKILICNAQYENVENTAEREEQKIQDFYAEMRKSTVRIEELQALILETEQSSAAQKADIAVYENDIEHSRSAIEAIIKRQSDSRASKAELDEKIKAMHERLAETDNRKSGVLKELDEVENSFIELEKEARSLEKIFDESGSEINAFYMKQSEHKLALASAESTAREISEQLEQLNSGEALLEADRAEYAAEAEEAKRFIEELSEHETELDNKLSGFDRLYKGKAQKLEEQKKSFENNGFALREKQQRVKLLTDLENSMEGFNYSVKEIMKASKTSRISGIHGTVAQLIRVKEEYGLAIETALGGALQNIVVENEDIAKRCIALLKELKKGRATFLPITSVKGSMLSEKSLEYEEGFVAVASELAECDEKYTSIINNLLGRIVIAEDLNCASRIAKKFGYKFRIVTLDGQVINAGGSFTGGAAVHSAGMLTRKNEIDDLNKLISKLEVDRNESGAVLERLRAETAKLGIELDGVRAEISRLAEDKYRAQADLSRLESMLKQCASQLDGSNAQRRRYSERLDECNEIRTKTNALLTELEAEIAKTESGIAGQQSRRDKLTESRRTLSEKLSELKIRDMELSKDGEAIKREIAGLEASKEAIEDSFMQFEREIEEQKTLTAEKQALIEESRRALCMVSENVAAYTSEIKLLQSRHNEQEQKINEIRAGLKAINEDKERLSKECTRLDERKIAAQKDLDTIVLQMWENYELTRSEAEKIAEPVENTVQTQKQLNEVRSQIKSLGHVNVAAIEEYKEVSERYSFMSAQLDDVNTSKRELEKLINELTFDMQKIFGECFAQINSNFKEIFVELFGGGKAELVLTDPENILESGIEIIVAPPGKVIKNLIALSGGEQAFVAIAIYFAILKIKPAPFCILDEIDAALDEVNVRKYAAYLKKFTHSTQFILVTHRRGTMELANVLYGVTMQENGISKLLKMKQVDIPDEVV